MEKLNHSIFWKVNQKQRFGFRKLSIGLAAVTLSTTLFLTTSRPIKADSTPAPATSSLVVQQNKNTDDTAKTNQTTPSSQSSANDQTNSEENSIKAEANTESVNTNKQAVKSNNNLAASDLSATDNKQENAKSETAASSNKSASTNKDDLSVNKDTQSKADSSSSSQTLVINKGNNTKNQTGNASLVQKDDKTSQSDLVKELTDSKVTKPEVKSETEAKTPSVTVDWTNKPTNNTVMAENDNLHLNVHIKNLPGAKVNDTFTLNVGNDWQITNAALNSPYFQITRKANSSSLDLTVIKDYGDNNDLSVDLPLIVRAAHTTSDKIVDLPVALTDNQSHKQIAEDNSIQKVTVTPLKDTTKNEAEKPFYIGYVNDDGNLPAADQGKKVLQWGLYWNYGQNSSSKQLSFDLHVSDGQTIVPSSIKVFVVDPKDAIKPNGNRLPLNEYYGKVTTGQIETDLQNLFRNNVKNNNEIKFDGTAFSTKTFFIQFDTMPSDDIVKNNKQTSVTVSPAFWWTQGGNGTGNTATAYSDPIKPGSSVGTYNAYLHVADVSDPTNIKDLNYNDQYSSQNVEDIISFANIANLIQELKQNNYELVGISTGTLTNTEDLASLSKKNIDAFISNNKFGKLTDADQHFTIDVIKNKPKPDKPGNSGNNTKPNNSGNDKPAKPGNSDKPTTSTPTPDNPTPEPAPTPQPNPVTPSNVEPQPESPVTPAQPSSVAPHAENSENPQTPEPESNNSETQTIAPHAEDSQDSSSANHESQNVAPHAETVQVTKNKKAQNVAPHPEAIKNAKQINAPTLASNKRQKEAPQLSFKTSTKVQELANKVQTENTQRKAKAALPQTGERQNNLSIIGLVLMALTGLFGLAIHGRRRKNN